MTVIFLKTVIRKEALKSPGFLVPSFPWDVNAAGSWQGQAAVEGLDSQTQQNNVGLGGGQAQPGRNTRAPVSVWLPPLRTKQTL